MGVLLPGPLRPAGPRPECDPLPGRDDGGLYPWQRPLDPLPARLHGDAPDFRRDGPDPQRVCLLGVLRGDLRAGFPLQGLLVEPRLEAPGLLPLRQQPRADVPHLFALRPGRETQPDPLSQGGRAQSFGTDRHHRGAPRRAAGLGGFRRLPGAVFRDPVLGQGFPRAVCLARTPAPEHPGPVRRQRGGRLQAPRLPRRVSDLGGVDHGDDLHGQGAVYGPQLRDRLGADLLPGL